MQRTSEMPLLILTVILLCRWWPFPCVTHGLRILIYIIPKYIIRMRIPSNLFAGMVVLLRKRCLDCHDIHPGSNGATSSATGAGEVAKRGSSPEAENKGEVASPRNIPPEKPLQEGGGQSCHYCTGNLPDITHASDTASLQKSLHQTLERF
jgi:hypothetical protein